MQRLTLCMLFRQIGGSVVKVENVGTLLEFPDKEVGSFFLPDLYEEHVEMPFSTVKRIRIRAIGSTLTSSFDSPLNPGSLSR
jgi:hypothetical protein